MSATAELVSLRAYARRRGCTLSSVQRAVSEGRITLVDGKVDPAIADAQWERNTDPVQSARANGGQLPLRPKSSLDDSPPEAAAPAAGSEYSDARARRERALAEMAELELQERQRQLVRVEDVKRAFAPRLVAVRTAIADAIERLASGLAAETDPEKIHQVLRREILEQALADLPSGGEVGSVR